MLRGAERSNPDEILVFRAFDRCLNQKGSCENVPDLRNVFFLLKPSRVLVRTAGWETHKTATSLHRGTPCVGLRWNRWNKDPGGILHRFWIALTPTSAHGFYLLLLSVAPWSMGTVLKYVKVDRFVHIAEEVLFFLRHFQREVPSQSTA